EEYADGRASLRPRFREKPRLPKRTGLEVDGVRHLKSPVSPSTQMHNAAFGSGRRPVIRQNENPARACVGQGRGLGNPHREHGSSAKITGDFGALNEGSTWATH